MFQMGGVGPMFGQFGHFFKFAADKVDDPYPTQRYLDETRRLLAVLDGRLEGRDYIMGADSLRRRRRPVPAPRAHPAPYA